MFPSRLGRRAGQPARRRLLCGIGGVLLGLYAQRFVMLQEREKEQRQERSHAVGYVCECDFVLTERSSLPDFVDAVVDQAEIVATKKKPDFSLGARGITHGEVAEDLVCV